MLLIIFFQVTCTCIVILPVLFSFQDLTKKIPDVFKDAVIQGMLEFEWDLFIEAKRKVSIQYICIVLALLTQCLNNVKLISQLNSNELTFSITACFDVKKEVSPIMMTSCLTYRM